MPDMEYRLGRETTPPTKSDMDGLRAEMVALCKIIIGMLLAQTLLLAWIALHMR